MRGAAVIVFWASLLFVAYAYLGYPALLALRRRLKARPARRGPATPSITVVIAARDEGARLLGKLENIRALDYPRDDLDVVIALDGDDGSAADLRALAATGVRVVVLPEHRGKAAALNAAVAEARGEIVVFADVRQRIAPDALRALVAPFADPEVGVVTGELVLTDEAGDEAADAVGLYWRYEKQIRAWESDVHSVVGATGALYAARRWLVAPLPEAAILDDVLTPMGLVLRGFRCVFEPGARVYDRVACCATAEYRRKVRTLAGNFQMLALMPQLLHPGRNPIWWQLVSHKVARLFVPYALLSLFVSTLFLTGPFYAAALAAQLAFYVLAALGAVLPPRRIPADLAPGEARSSIS
jgi:cellulose synthase/poly-beta-1,6-N-acetylglucosamine synthase-like glycosyltransferase